jgi:hypothetical protein
MRMVLPTLGSRRRVAGVKAEEMNSRPLIASQAVHCELRFHSLRDAGRFYAFPCDAAGNVDMDSLSDKARQNYLYARTVIGREFSHPAVMINSGD